MSDDTTQVETFMCESCEDEIPGGEEVSHWDNIYCQSCFDDTFSYCDWCHEYADADYFSTAYSGRYNEIFICESCASNGDFARCAGCGTINEHDYMICGDDGCYCEECEGDGRNDGWIRSYHDNPPFRFIHGDGRSTESMTQGEYYLGVEIELENAVSFLNDSGFVPEQGVFNKIWACHDGSLNRDGVEIISMPGTLEAWRKGYVIPWSEWYDQVHAVVPGQSQYTTNGIHVHVSRAAFNRSIFNGHRGFKESAAHLFKFLMFIERNELVMHHIGGREQRSSYAKFNAKDAKENRKRIVKKESYADRYNIVNVGNRHTIELRFFDGRSETEHIKRCIELTHAMVEYTRGVSPKSSSMEFGAFIDWVMQRRAIYPALWAYVMGNSPLLKKIAEQSQLDYEAMTHGVKSKALDVQDRFQRNRTIAAQAMRDVYYTDDASSECDCAFCTIVNG